MRPRYTVIYREEDGRSLVVGCISSTRPYGPESEERPWAWSVEFHQWKGRQDPYSGREVTFEDATAAWKRCWDSADVPIDWPPSLR
jgi:hypothetical protein